MTIMTDANGNVFLAFMQVPEDELGNISLDAPLTHSLIVVKRQDSFLFMYNKWRQIWELPGGVIEQGETARQCAVRELF
ncbi:NUDIX domain-containing protein [Paenibacillus sp. TAB 01]|uniref:NUDIX domain-containing protein n=1 Tax=Paenibacillus sp. TAB 01 TaxID=3368988 RepID=UPI00375382AE